jgi:flagella basal body P-ring formation protein FlgA
MCRQLLFMLFLLFPAVLWADIVVSLKAEVVVPKRVFTLGDIATVKGGVRQKELENIQIGKSSRPGYFIDVSRESIQTRLYKYHPDIASNIQWRGDKVRVRSSGRKMDVSKLEQLARLTLEDWLSSRYFSHSKKLTHSIKEIMLPQGDVTIDASVCSVDKANKRMCVWADINIDGQHYQTYQLWFDVSAKQKVYVARNKIEGKTPISQSHFYKELRDIAVETNVPVAIDFQLNNRRAVKGIEAGSILAESLVEIIPLVSKGDVVDVYAYAGSVGIYTKALALRNGNLDETISVLNPKTEGRYEAVVVAPGRVEVQ